MLARYLGNKQAIMDPLLATIGEYCNPGDHVVDIFSGSVAVSMGLKRQGYRVTANDINLFSSTIAEAYLVPTEPPAVDLAATLSGKHIAVRLAEAKAIAAQLTGKQGYAFLHNPEWRLRYETFVALQQHLQHLDYSDLPSSHQRQDFFDAYCEEGKKSSFVSLRGTVGRRRFFSPFNARRIDLVLNQLRLWKQQGVVDKATHALLLSTLIRAVEKVSNTQGTYHDFPRDKWDSRALNELKLAPPALDDLVAGVGGHMAGKEQDSLEFIKTVGDHALLYLDPPYNFRQYTAYYFLPNVICRYADIEDLDAYFDKLAYVRGQNPEDDFTSSFCKPATFINDMRTMISRARCDRVMISYFNGANHWSKFDSGPNDVGQGMLEELLSEDLFEPSSLTVKSVPRMNYASYGGFKARSVNELIMTAKLRKTEKHESTQFTDEWLHSVA